MRQLLIAIMLVLIPVSGVCDHGKGYTGYEMDHAYDAYDTHGDEGSSVNLLADSWQYESTFWKGVDAAVLITPGQADPFSGTKASKMENVGAPSASHQEKTVVFANLFTDNVVLSCYIKALPGNVPDNGDIRLSNQTIGSGAGGLCIQRYIWTGTVLSAGTATGDNTTGGVIAIGAGYYRVYVAVDITENKASEGWQDTDNYTAIINLWGTDSTAGHALFLDAFQLEPGATPGAYVETP